MFFICSSSPEIYNSSPKYLGGVFLWYILSMTFIEEGIILSNENTQEENSKPKYNMLQNSWFMIKTAWQINEGKMIFLCLLSAVFALVTNVLNLQKRSSLSKIFGVSTGFSSLVECSRPVFSLTH